MKKKKILGSIAVLVIATITAFNVNVNTLENGLSDISLNNVEALATEIGHGAWCCGWFGYCNWSTSGQFSVVPCQ